MNSHNPFEARLQGQPFQTPPAAWKQEILAEATRHQRAVQTTAASSLLFNLWHEWIAPYRRAYAGIAAAWVLILLLCATTPIDPASEELARSIKTSPQIETQLVAQWEQRQLQRSLGL